MPNSRGELHPVIHYLDPSTTLFNAEIAANTGCAGVMLIQMEGRDHLLDDAIGAIKSRFPDLEVGVNRLSSGRTAALQRNLALGADSTWVDQGGVTAAGPDALAMEIQHMLRPYPRHKFYCGVAFKYQKPIADPARAAQLAAQFGFIPTTSGDATGEAPTMDKLRTMAFGLPSRQLALASGVSADNAAAFAPFVRYFLVSTRISRTFHEFDANKVKDLARIIHTCA